MPCAAWARRSTNLDDDRLVLKQVPTIYPSGGEDQLVQLVTNREVPSGGLPTDVGCLVQNVGTAAAVHDWIINHEPLISRVTTVAGDGIANPMNVRARIGTTIADVVKFTGRLRRARRPPDHWRTHDRQVDEHRSRAAGQSDQLDPGRSENLVSRAANWPAFAAATVPLSVRCSCCRNSCSGMRASDNESKVARFRADRLHRVWLLRPGLSEPHSVNRQFPGQRKAASRNSRTRKSRADRARRRFEARNERLEQEKQQRDDRTREAEGIGKRRPGPPRSRRFWNASNTSARTTERWSLRAADSPYWSAGLPFRD